MEMAPDGESFCPSFVPADNTWLGFATARAQGLVRVFDAQTTKSLNLVLLLFVWARAASAAPGSREPSRKASRPSGFDPSRDHESLAGGTRPRSRRHFIPASLSLPFLRVPLSLACASLRAASQASKGAITSLDSCQMPIVRWRVITRARCFPTASVSRRRALSSDALQPSQIEDSISDYI